MLFSIISLSSVAILLKLVYSGVITDMVDVKENNAIKEVRILYYEQSSSYVLTRGRPLFAEIDFIPKYLPQYTHYMSVSVILPKQIRATARGEPWVLGFHQELFYVPKCRLCTNHNQSYTIPVTLYLADDSWCAEGSVPTGWKIEAVPQNPSMADNTDMIIGVAVDERAQIKIVNANQSVNCKNRQEVINYTMPIQ